MQEQNERRTDDGSEDSPQGVPDGGDNAFQNNRESPEPLPSVYINIPPGSNFQVTEMSPLFTIK